MIDSKELCSMTEMTEYEMEPSQRNVFTAWQYRHLFTFQNLRGKNVVVMCNLCLPKVNLLSTSRYSTSNLKKHLEVRYRSANFAMCSFV